ncbi:MAG: serine hydrolase, partial [Burkholderiaceae bacterium]
FAGGGLLAVLRDLARFGEIMRMGGKQANQQIIPKSVVNAICKGGDQAKFKPAGYTSLPGWSYGYMWWHAHDDHEVFTARGVHGQTIYIDPKAEMVIARFASHPIAANVQIDPHSLPAYRALAKHLLREGS